MNELENRKRSAEALFVDEQNRAFREKSRQLRAIGIWAAGLLGLGEEATEAYADKLAGLVISHPAPGVASVARDRVIADLGKLAVAADIDAAFAALEGAAA